MCRLNEKYGTRVFSFVDETFEGKRMEQLADEINASGKTFFWHGETRFSPTLSTEVLTRYTKVDVGRFSLASSHTTKEFLI